MPKKLKPTVDQLAHAYAYCMVCVFEVVSRENQSNVIFRLPTMKLRSDVI